MDALSFLSLWRAITSVSREIPNEEDEDDSFFELEFTIPETTPTNRGSLRSNQKQSRSFHSNHGDFFSKRKILPIESTPSPVSLLKSAPRFRVFMFRKKKTVSTSGRGKTYHVENKGSNSFTVRLKMKDLEPNLARDFSPSEEDSCLIGSNSKRFAKAVIRKYLKLFRPLYVKVSRKQSSKMKLVDEVSVSPSPASRESYRNSLPGSRVVSRQLSKSKSSTATVAGFISPARRDDSLIQQHDGIECAILHCKRSFSSSRDFGVLSRSASVHDNVFESARISVEQTSRSSVSF